MVLSKREFNRDLDSYIRSRKRQHIFQSFRNAGLAFDEEARQPATPAPSPAVKEMPVMKVDDLTPEERAKFNAMKEQGFSRTSEDDEIKSMKGDRKKGLFAALSKMMKGNPSAEEETPILHVNSDDLDPAIEELLKGILKWLDELPVTAQRRFRKSAEYELYRQVIDKYGLGKK